jgi:hypothetical protein
MAVQHQYLLHEGKLPTRWYDIVPDLLSPLHAVQRIPDEFSISTVAAPRVHRPDQALGTGPWSTPGFSDSELTSALASVPVLTRDGALAVAHSVTVTPFQNAT